jgi:hypothetical protein
MIRPLVLVLALASTGLVFRADEPHAVHAAFDEVLDAYVRDGLVYYRALRAERSRLDSYLSALERLPRGLVDAWPRDARVALWLNAYNAIVLRTVIDRYPIRGRSAEYPRNSIRQIPGAFDRTAHSVAGRSVTLDQIERDLLLPLEDPRVILALGRGSVGGGRLRSEAFTPDRLEAQLQGVAAEFPTREELLRIDAAAGTVSVTPLLSWREAAFASAYAGRADERFAARSPLERALVAFMTPHLLPGERDFVMKNEFRTVFHEYDWRLNDLTGGAGR